MSASKRLTIPWLDAFSGLLIGVCRGQRSHLIRMLECKLMGLVGHAASAAAYVGNGAPFPIVG